MTTPRPGQVQGTTSPEPFPGFNELRNNTRAEANELTTRAQTLTMQREGLLAVPRPIPRGQGLGIVDVAKITTAASASEAARQRSIIAPIVAGKAAVESIAGALGFKQATTTPLFVPRIKPPEEIAQAVDQMRVLAQETDSITVDSIRANWRAHVLEWIPRAVHGDEDNPPLTTTDQLIEQFVTAGDIKSQVPNLSDILTKEDIRFASDVLDRALRAKQTVPVPALTPERRQAIIRQISRNRSASVYGLLVGSGENLLDQLIEIAQPRPPEGMTDAEFRTMVGDAGFTDEETEARVAASNSVTTSIRESMIDTTAQYAVMLSNLRGLELDKLQDELTRRSVTELVSRPLVALMLPVDYWRRAVVKPLAGAAFLGLKQKLPTVGWFGGGPLFPVANEDAEEFDRLFTDARRDLNYWEALGYAFENSSMGGFQKFMLEVVADPITYFGFGAYAKVLRAIPRGYGVPLAGIEEGYVKGIDMAFLGLKRGMAKVGRKTTNMMVRQETRLAFNKVKAFVEASGLESSAVIRPFRSVPLEDVQKYLRRAVKLAKANPGDSTDAVSVGRILRNQPPVSRQSVDALNARLEAFNVPKVDVDAVDMLGINDTLRYTKGLGGQVLVPDEAAGQIMHLAGVLSDADGKAMQATKSWVTEVIETSDNLAEGIISSSNTVQGLHDALFSHINMTTRAELTSPLRQEGFRVGSLSANWTQLESVAKIVWSNRMDSISRGFAKSYLMFAFYGQFNILETGLKTVYMGLKPWFRGDMVRQLQAYNVGLIGLPELFTSHKGFLLDIGPDKLIEAGNKGRLFGLGRTTYNRISKQNTAVWKKFFDGVESLLIGVAGRIGRQQNANLLYQAQTRALRRLQPEITNRLVTLIQEEAVALEAAGIRGRLLQSVMSEAEDRAVVNARALGQMHKDFTPDSVILAEVAELVQKHGELGPLGMAHVLESADAGSLFPRLTQILDEEVPDLLRQQALRSPELMRIQLGKLMDELIAHPPANLADLRLRIQTLQGLGTDISGAISAQTRATQEYGRDILNLQRKGDVYNEMWDEILIPFIRESEEKIQTYVGQLKESLGRLGDDLPLSKGVQFDMLLDHHLQRVALLRNTWEEYGALTRELIAERDVIRAGIEGRVNVDNPLIRAWWEKFHSSRESFWNVQREVLARADADLLEFGASVDNVLIPQVNAAGRALTVSDVGQLFNSVPADLTRAMYVPELGMLQEKVAWVERIFARAKSVAARQGNRQPEDIGFSRPAIEQVYDDIIRDMTGSAEVAELVAPALMDVQSLKEELLHFAGRKNAILPQEQQDALQAFGQRLLGRIQGDEVAGRVLLNEPDLVPASQVVRLISRIRQVYGKGTDVRNPKVFKDMGEFRRYVNAAAKKAGIREGDFPVKPHPLTQGSAQGSMLFAGSRMRAAHRAIRAEGFDGIRIAGKAPGLADVLDSTASFSPAKLAKLEGRVMHGELNPDAGDVWALLDDTPALERISDDADFVKRWFDLLEEAGDEGDIIRLRIVEWVDEVSGRGLEDAGQLASSSSPEMVRYRAGLHKMLRERYGDEIVVYKGGFVLDPLEETVGEFRHVSTTFETSKHFAPPFGTGRVDMATVKVEDVVALGSFWESELIVKSSAVRPIREIDEIPERAGFSWNRERQKALDSAMDEYRLNLPDYDDPTVLNSVGRAAFPFWTYETHRMFWLPRTWLRTPGTYTALGKYQDYTDNGYIHVPGTSWELNPLRGTIWMGGLRRLVLRDFPEFYDKYPGLANAFDWLSRFGFYPNVFITGAFATGALTKTGKSQLGEILPSIAQTPLEAYVAARPDSFSAQFLLDKLLSTRFRNYLVAQKVGEAGGPGVNILDKKTTGTPLDADDDRWWNIGQRGAAVFNMINSQMGLFRMRAEERIEFDRAAKVVIEEATGVPVALQEEMARVGMRIAEFMPVRREVQDLVRELEGFTRWRGLTSHLRESELGQNMARLRLFWTEIDDDAGRVRIQRDLNDQQWLNGSINESRWKAARRELRSEIPKLVDIKRADPRFQMEMDGEQFPIPLTLQERQDFAKLHNFNPVVMDAEDELAAMYHLVELEEGFDVEAGGIVTLWDRFFAEREAIEGAVQVERQQAFYDRIHKNDTRLDRLFRQDQDVYLRPYRKAFDFILTTLSEEEQAIVKEANYTSDLDRLQELLAAERDDGVNIVSAFRSELTQFRSRWRQLDPELDARLAIWEGLLPKTDQALQLYRKLRTQYGFRSAPDVEDLTVE